MKQAQTRGTQEESIIIWSRKEGRKFTHPWHHYVNMTFCIAGPKSRRQQGLMLQSPMLQVARPIPAMVMSLPATNIPFAAVAYCCNVNLHQVSK